MPIPFHQALARNIERECSVPWCNRPRHQIGKYCNSHNVKRCHWGHPEGRHIKPCEYKQEREEVSRLVELNMDHPGIQDSLKILEDFLKRAREGDTRIPYPHLIANVHDAGITPMDLLVETSALWLLETKRPDLIKDKKHLCYLIGHKVIKPRVGVNEFLHKKMTGKERRLVGEYLRRRLVPMWVNVARHTNKHQTER